MVDLDVISAFCAGMSFAIAAECAVKWLENRRGSHGLLFWLNFVAFGFNALLVLT